MPSLFAHYVLRTANQSSADTYVIELRDGVGEAALGLVVEGDDREGIDPCRDVRFARHAAVHKNLPRLPK